MNQHIKTSLGISIILIFAITAGVFTWKAYQASERARVDFKPVIVLPSKKFVQPKMCNQEAKLCPDGKTSVSRNGPNCEFTECPDPSMADWKTYRNNRYGFEFRYPKEFIFRSVENAEGDLYLIGNFNGNSGGSIGLAIKNLPLDRNNIEGFLGKVDPEDLEVINVGGKVAFVYIAGDAGCGGRFVSIPVADKTLEMSFVDCDEGSEVESKRVKILSTFEFAK